MVQQSFRSTRSCFSCWLFCLLVLVSTTNSSSNNNKSNNIHNVLLDEDSVVLITGAAGFVGSELAIALHRTYQVKKLICIDSLDSNGQFGNAAYQRQDSDLSLLEYKRQRLFRLFQAVPSTFFYRVDFRPAIPEYWDSSEVPVLDHIFQEHSDITHVVHLADHYHRSGQESLLKHQVVPRVSQQEKAGMMESILEQLRLHQERNKNNNNSKNIQFIYASSGDVYNALDTDNTNDNDSIPNPPPFREDLPITTPSSMAGVTKLLDEMMARAYYETFHVPSTGLRFFSIYGPWGLPGSPVFEMAEAAVTEDEDKPNNLLKAATKDQPETVLDHIQDYVFIDDAIDAIMSAMQFQQHKQQQPLIFNVGSGKGVSLRQMAQIIREKIAPNGKHATEDLAARSTTVTSFANTDRSRTVLGFQPQVSLEQGLRRTLAWHYDRAYPYGTGADFTTSNDNNNNNSNNNNNHLKLIASQGMVSCSPYDVECLLGTPVFPCASECSQPQQCISTLYDDIQALTRALTAECTTVLYTVSLDTAVNDIPSVHVRVSSRSVAYVQGGGGHCNIAMIPESSPLYQQQKVKAVDNPGKIVKFGFWTLVPLAVSEYITNSTTTTVSPAHNKNLLQMLPKLSPSSFFGPKVEHAIYCDIDMVLDSIPRLLQESEMQPAYPSDKHNSKGATALLIGKRADDMFKHKQHPLFTATATAPDKAQQIQEIAYRTVRMAVIDEMMGDGFAQQVDSSVMVHSLNHRNDDARFFRCDILGEVIQWKVQTDQAAIEFIMGLHDMWSRVMVQKTGVSPWWIGENVKTVAATVDDHLDLTFGKHRRLEEVVEEESDEEEDEEEEEEEEEDHSDSAGAGLGVVQDAIQAVFGDFVGTGSQGRDDQDKNLKPVKRFDRPDEDEGDDFIVEEDDDTALPDSIDGARGVGGPAGGPKKVPDADPSTYDIWMGVLSSTDIRWFSRIVSLAAVGAYRVDHYDNDGRVSSEL